MFKTNEEYKKVKEFYKQYDKNKISSTTNNLVSVFLYLFTLIFAVVIFLAFEHYALLGITFLIVSFGSVIEYHYSERAGLERIIYYRRETRKRRPLSKVK